jgi:hypothetical protein
MSTENVTRFYHKNKNNNQLEEDFSKLNGRAKIANDGSKIKFLKNGSVAILRLGDATSDGVLEIHDKGLSSKYRVKVKYTK